jgi:ribosomal protein S18 acetylase RimI-like enzyme
MQGVMIRGALPTDAPEIASLNVRCWQAAYRGHIPDAFLDALDPAQQADWWSQRIRDPHTTVLVAVDAASLVGYCSLLPSRDEDAPSGACELVTLYVDPNRWRAGCGTALVFAAMARARERGFQELSLWVLATNTAARAFYGSLGFWHDGSSKTDSRLGVALHEVRYRRELPPGTL